MREAGKGQFNSQPLKGKLIRRDCSIAKAIPSYETGFYSEVCLGFRL
jgi:hypothetical protein